MKIHHEQINQLYKQTPKAVFGHLTTVCIITYILSGSVPETSLLLWNLLLFLSLLLRLLVFYLYKQGDQYTNPNCNLKKWRRLSQASVFFTGVLWGASVYFYDYFQLADYYLLLAAVCFSMVGSATITLGVVFSVYLFFAMPMLSIIAIAMLLSDNQVHVEAGFLVLVGIGFAVSTAYQYSKNSHKILLRTYELSQANQIISQQADSLEIKVKQRSEELLAARDEAIKANRAKSEFLAKMSHELRTPMNAILGFGQLLELDEENLNTTQHENIREILDAGDHLLWLINEILDLAKIESAALIITKEKVHLKNIFQQSLKLITTQIKTRQIKLIDNISDKGYCVIADPVRLKQAIVNLLANAVKYNRECGTIILDAKLIRKEDGVKCLRICITDTGIGLSEAEIKQLFVPFERLNSIDNIEGTGIGLTITKNLIELMDGHMGVESTRGEGSTFWLELAVL